MSFCMQYRLSSIKIGLNCTYLRMNFLPLSHVYIQHTWLIAQLRKHKAISMIISLQKAQHVSLSDFKVKGSEINNKNYCFKTYFASPHLIEAQYWVNSFAVKGEIISENKLNAINEFLLPLNKQRIFNAARLFQIYCG